MKYRYLYQTKDNENREGWINAPNRENAYTQLRKQGIRPYRVIGDDPVNWKPWAIGGVIIVLAAALLIAFLRLTDTRGEIARTQLVGDRELIATGADSVWEGVLTDPLDRTLAGFVQPGRIVPRYNPTAEERGAFAAALGKKIVYAKGERSEHRMLRNIIAKMRADMKAYLDDGGSVDDYLAFLSERQEQEADFRERAMDAIYRAPESMRYRVWLGVNVRLKDMGIEPISRPSDLSEPDPI